jgi:transposase
MRRRRFARESRSRQSSLSRNAGYRWRRPPGTWTFHENVLRKWVNEFGTDPVQAFPGQGQLKPEQQEIERLRREVNKLKAERDILKKATAFFAKEAT